MKFISLFILLNISLGLSAQTYQIIKIAGDISTCENDSSFKKGDKLQVDQSLCFTNTDTSYAVAAIVEVGSAKRYVLRAKNREAGIQKELVKDCLIPSRALTGNRKGKINTLIELRTLLGEEEFLILGGNLTLDIGEEGIPMNADNFFYVSYTYKGETINKKLSFQGQQLSLNAGEIFKVDEVPIDRDATSNFQLNYFQKGQGPAKIVSAFTPLFPDDSQIKEELGILTDALRGSTADLKENWVSYLMETYGKVEIDNFEAWMKVNMEQ